MKTKGVDLIPIAQTLYKQRLLPIPLYFGTKVPAVKWSLWQENKPSWNKVANAFSTTLYRNIGILTGAISGNLTVLDFDKPNEYAVWHRQYPLDTRTVRTSRGIHVYLRLVKLPSGTLSMEGGEIKSSGYVVAPPSSHSSGREYFYRNSGPIYVAESLAQIGIMPTLPEKILRSQVAPTLSKNGSKPQLISEIKRMLPITRLLMQYTELLPSGGYFLKGRCPLHNDNKPSLWVNYRLGICSCFSVKCIGHGRPMDVINLYARLTGISNRDSIIALGERLGLI